MSGFTGNLGDGASRTYSTGIIYSSLGGLAKEQFGTTTPIYNKLFYNVRGQLAEIRDSTNYTGPTATTWNRGAIINHYSDQCWGMCSGHSMTDNSVGCLRDGIPTDCNKVMNDINKGQAKTVLVSGTQNPNVVLANAGFIPQVGTQQVTGGFPDPLDERNAVPVAVDAIDSVVIVPGGQAGRVANPQNSAQEFQHTQAKRRATKTQPKSKSACDHFAEELASRLWSTIVEEGGFNADSRHELARDMVLQAYRDTDYNGYAYRKFSYPIDGFKLPLTDYGQDADVYHHILFTAGNALHGTAGGDAENWAFRRYDQHQADSGRRESIAELADDDAGMEVGQRMLETALAGRSGDYWGLKASIKNILCAH